MIKLNGPAAARWPAIGGAAITAVMLVLSSSGAAVAAPATNWTGTWSVSPHVVANPNLSHYTIRTPVYDVLAGSQVRIQISNAFGDSPVTIGAAAVSILLPLGDLQADSVHRLTFGGQSTATVAPGARLRSDPVDMTVAAGDDLAVDLYFTDTGTGEFATGHDDYIVLMGPGDKTGLVHGDGIKWVRQLQTTWWLTGVDVMSPAQGSIVALGDEVTEGQTLLHYGYPKYQLRWSSLLADRLGGRYGVLNEGLTSDRLLSSGDYVPGRSALDREEADVKLQTGVKYVILADGLNDLSLTDAKAADLIAGIKTFTRRAHKAGIKVIGTTIIPSYCGEGPPCLTAKREKVRQRVNAWIRRSTLLDGVADFDAAVRDPDHPAQLAQQYLDLLAFPADYSIPPNAAGQHALADAIDLTLFD